MKPRQKLTTVNFSKPYQKLTTVNFPGAARDGVQGADGAFVRDGAVT